jgi:hypothetical protein
VVPPQWLVKTISGSMSWLLGVFLLHHVWKPGAQNSQNRENFHSARPPPVKKQLAANYSP